MRRALVFLTVVALATGLAGGAAPARAEVDPAGVAAARVPANNEQNYRQYVTRVYQDLLQREPDAAGLRTWVRQLAAGVPWGSVANAITNSPEYRSRLIRELYAEHLGRQPDPTGLAYWLAMMDGGWTVARISAGFIASDEYYRRAGGMPSTWVEALYEGVLDRSAGAAEVAYWTDRVRGGTSRGAVAMGFLLSAERLSTVVDGYYRQLLGRGLDPSGRATWVGILQAGGRDESIIAGIVSSVEYWNRAFELEPEVPLEIVTGPGQVRAGELFVPHGSGHFEDKYGPYALPFDSTATFSIVGHPDACTAAGCVLTVAGQYTLTARWRGVERSSRLEVTAGRAAELALHPAEVSVANWEAVRYQVTGRDIYGNAITSSPLTISGQDCLWNECRTATPGRHIVRTTLDGVTATAVQDVAEPGPVGLELYTLSGYPSTVATQVGDDRWTAASAGDHWLAIRTDGTLWAWGKNNYGQLGDPALGLAESAPQRIGDESAWIDACVSADMSLGIRADGSLWLWGYYRKAMPIPFYVQVPGRLTDKVGWNRLVCDNRAAFAFNDDGTLWAMGYLGEAELASYDARTPVWPPALVDTSPSGRIPVVVDLDFATGLIDGLTIAEPSTVLGITAGGELWSWGQCGVPTFGRPCTPRSIVHPQRVGTDLWRDASTDGSRVTAVGADGSLWRWGALDAACAVDDTRTCTIEPLRVGVATSWRSAVQLSDHALLLDGGGNLWTLANGLGASPVRLAVGGGWVEIGDGYALRQPGSGG